MAIMGRMRVVVVRTARKLDDDSDDEKHGKRRDKRFRKPGRIGHHYEAGIDYRSIEYNTKDDISDLLPDEVEVIEKLKEPSELKYILTVNFDSPTTKPINTQT